MLIIDNFFKKETQMSYNLLIAKGNREHFLLPQMANRHCLITGATGTGKTVSLQVMAENFSSIGVPVFVADVKGDLAGISQPGIPTQKILERIEKLGLNDFKFSGFPVVFWDVFGEQGHPLRATISDMGPLLLSRLLNLNEIQSGVLTLVFKIADDNGLLLLDLKDLRAMLQFVGDNADKFTTEYGKVSTASIGAIQRALLSLEEQGVDKFFGEPSLDLKHLIQTDFQGKGIINILVADKLITMPKAYATFLLWLLSELFENLPEVGDLEKPRLIFFFDEAHLLFNDAPKILLEKIEQVVRLIRSKGVGIFFVTQSPLDIPNNILGQLGNRVQHALRAFTPQDQKLVKAVSQTFRTNPDLDIEKTITELKVGEALVSFLEENGQPEIVDRAYILPPKSQIGAINYDLRMKIIQQSQFYGLYDKLIDRESAYEILKARALADNSKLNTEILSNQESSSPKYQERKSVRKSDSILESLAKSAARTVGQELGRQILRGILGSILGGRR